MGTAIDQAVTDFIFAITRIRSMFREMHIVGERSARFGLVTADVIPTGTEEKADARVAIVLMGELRHPRDSAHQAFGISLEIGSNTDGWEVVAETGWSGRDIGWDVIDSTEATSKTLADAISESLVLARWLCDEFATAANAHEGDT